MLTFSINFVQCAGILLETLEHVGPRVTKPTMRQPSYYVPCLSGGNSPALAFPIVISIYRSCQGAEPKCYNLYMFLYSYSYKRLSWWWWCVCHPSFMTIRSASNGCEVSCGIFATIAHFSAPICRKPLIILKATTSLPHLIKTAWEIYFEWKVLPPFLNICLSRDFNKWLHTEQNEWIYTSKYVYIIRMW